VAKIIPEIKSFKPIRFPDFTKTVLDNGIPVYQLISGDYDVMKLEISFRAGRYFEQGPGVGKACANLLREGTKNFNASYIADIFDYHGASFQTNGSMDFSRIELYTINRYFPTLLPHVADIITEPSFEEKELNNYRQRNIQRLAIDLAKNDVLAYRWFTEWLFGKDHPYGYNSDKETFQQLETVSLREHFNRCILHAVPSIIVAGGIDDSMIRLLNDTFGGLPTRLPEIPEFTVVNNNSAEPVRLTGQQKFQASIRTGRRLFSRSHPDYPGIYLLNTVLGGFFGSRLMQNIREDKGLTYDIYSLLDMYWTDGYLMIGAEVDNDNTDLVIDEIRRECRKLQQEPLGSDELILVKNYLNGNLLNLMNGPFNAIELMRLIAVYGYDLAFFDYFMHRIHQIDAEELMELAKKYLDPEDFSWVIAGK
jgi:predicted Zn-dependent peptidase